MCFANTKSNKKEDESSCSIMFSILNHFNPWLPKGAINEVKKYINISKAESKTTELGHTFKLN